MKENSFPPGLVEGSLIKRKNYASDCEPFEDCNYCDIHNGMKEAAKSTYS